MRDTGPVEMLAHTAIALPAASIASCADGSCEPPGARLLGALHASVAASKCTACTSRSAAEYHTTMASPDGAEATRGIAPGAVAASKTCALQVPVAAVYRETRMPPGGGKNASHTTTALPWGSTATWGLRPGGSGNTSTVGSQVSSAIEYRRAWIPP